MDLNDTHKQIVHAAVVVLHERATDSLVLTKRSEHLRAHPGEISFPGGIWEQGDKDLYTTALRELHEELGISPERITLIRALNTEQTLLGRVIHPWFASIESITPYQLNLHEVTRLITIPMSMVRAAGNYKDIFVAREGLRFKSCEFCYEGDWIWGATARIMKQLIKKQDEPQH